MNMKRFSIISLLLWIGILAFASGKPKVMWLDCSANFQRFSYPDSIRFYVDKCHEAGTRIWYWTLKTIRVKYYIPANMPHRRRIGKTSTVRI
mgnify:CR=1 FL=1